VPSSSWVRLSDLDSAAEKQDHQPQTSIVQLPYSTWAVKSSLVAGLLARIVSSLELLGMPFTVLVLLQSFLRVLTEDFGFCLLFRVVSLICPL
jgi:hypothetical protein